MPPYGESPLSVNGEDLSEPPAARARDASGGADALMAPPPAGGTAAAGEAGLPAAPHRAPQTHAARAPHSALPAGVVLAVPRAKVVTAKDSLPCDSDGRYGAGFCRMPVVEGGRTKGTTFELDCMPGLPLCAGTCRRSNNGTTIGLMCRPCLDWAAKQAEATTPAFWEGLYAKRKGA